MGCEPLFITESGFASLDNRLAPAAAGDVEVIQIVQEREEDAVQFLKNVAVIQIHGVIAKGLEDWQKRWYGMVDIDDVREQLNRPEVATADVVLLDIDSPGGFATGVHELATDIANRNQLIVGFTDSEMASAAYYIGSACKHLVCSPCAAVGSVGVYTVLIDSSQAYQREGYNVEVIRSGEHKGGGVDGAPISETFRKDVQESVDARGRAFREFVSSQRSLIDFEHLEGQVFLGEDAEQLGFVDAVANSKDELIDQLVD